MWQGTLSLQPYVYCFVPTNLSGVNIVRDCKYSEWKLLAIQNITQPTVVKLNTSWVDGRLSLSYITVRTKENDSPWVERRIWCMIEGISHLRCVILTRPRPGNLRERLESVATRVSCGWRLPEGSKIRSRPSLGCTLGSCWRGRQSSVFSDIFPFHTKQ